MEGGVRRMIQKQFREVNNKSIYTYMVSVTAAAPLSLLPSPIGDINNFDGG